MLKALLVNGSIPTIMKPSLSKEQGKSKQKEQGGREPEKKKRGLMNARVP